VTEKYQRQVATFIRNVTDVPSIEIETFCTFASERLYGKGEGFVGAGERCTETLFIRRGAFRYTSLRYDPRK